jgi:hypothetical protein
VTLPAPPEDVRVRLSEGAEIVCDLLYDGERDGIHHWIAVPRVPVHLGPGVSLLLGVLPARTSVGIAGAEPP